MKRLRRWLSVGSLTFSLLLAAATIFLWLRSIRYVDSARIETDSSSENDLIFWAFTGPQVLEFAGGHQGATYLDLSRKRGVFLNATKPIAAQPNSLASGPASLTAKAANNSDAPGLFEIGQTSVNPYFLKPAPTPGLTLATENQKQMHLAMNSVPPPTYKILPSRTQFGGILPVPSTSAPTSGPGYGNFHVYSPNGNMAFAPNGVFYTRSAILRFPGWQRPAHGIAGLRWDSSSDLPGIHPPYWRLDIPFWLILLLASILPFRAIQIFWREFTRPQKGLCPTCGYDLRATPNRCPECGSISTNPAIQ